MSAIININDKAVTRIEYHGKAIISCSMVDKIHEKTQKTAYQAFIHHKHRFVEGKHYFDLPYEVWSGFAVFDVLDHQTTENGFGGGATPPPNTKTRGGHTRNMIFLTEIGYAKLIKSFDDDLAWEIYDLMVDNYFNVPTRVVEVPEDQQQLLGMWSWLRARKVAMKAEMKDIVQMEKECLEKLDKLAPAFRIPASKQPSLPLR